MNKLAFIGGTGVYDSGILSDIRSEIINTPFGQAACQIGYFKGKEIVFLAQLAQALNLDEKFVEQLEKQAGFN